MKNKRYIFIALIILLLFLFFMNIKEGLDNMDIIDISMNDISMNDISMNDISMNDISMNIASLYDITISDINENYYQSNETESKNYDQELCYKKSKGTGLKIHHAKNIRDILRYSEFDADSSDKLSLLQDINVPKTDDSMIYRLINNSNKTPDERINKLNDIINRYDLCK